VSRTTRHVSLTVALYQPTCSNWTLIAQLMDRVTNLSDGDHPRHSCYHQDMNKDTQHKGKCLKPPRPRPKVGQSAKAKSFQAKATTFHTKTKDKKSVLKRRPNSNSRNMLTLFIHDPFTVHCAQWSYEHYFWCHQHLVLWIRWNEVIAWKQEKKKKLTEAWKVCVSVCVVHACVHACYVN